MNRSIMIHKKRTERKTLIGNQRDMDFLIAFLCKRIIAWKTMEGFIVDDKCSVFECWCNLDFLYQKNTSAGKWETFYGSLRKLWEKLLEYNRGN